MARRRTATPKFFEKYPGVYQYTTDTWTTRYYQRKSDPLFNLLGLNTAPDDLHKKDGGSPYLANVRFMGEREESQRAQAMSRLGAKYMNTLGESTVNEQESSAKSYLELYEGKAIEWDFNHNRRLTRLSLHLYNRDQAGGFLKLSVRDRDTRKELATGLVNLEQVDTRKYERYLVRMIRAVSNTALTIRAEILEDVDDMEPRETTRERRAVRILATPYGRHRAAIYNLPNVDESLQEIPYEFEDRPNVPMMGYSINSWEPMVRSHPVRIQGRDYIIFPVRHDGLVELYRTDLITNETSIVTQNVAPTAKQVRFAQAEGYLYYVDGISPLRRLNLTTLATEDVVPLPADIEAEGVLPAALTAKAGASLIKFMTNRLYLSGFADDPNLVIYSLIDNTKPRFEQYNDRFYSPDQAPQASAPNPITALETVSEYLIVFRVEDLSLYTPDAGLEDGQPVQVTPEGASLGVLNQEAVCKGKNNVYFYNPIEGVARFAGSVNRVISGDIENLLARIRHPESVFMVYQKQRVRMYFSFDGTVNDSCFYYYQELEGRLPWYMDKNTPVSSAVPMKKSSDVIAIHSEVPTVYSVDAKNQLTDFDSYIEAEYHTPYVTTNPNNELFIRRLHVHELADSDHNLYVGLDIDHQDRPIVYRRFIPQPEQPEDNPDAIFQQTAEAGITVASFMMHVRCRRYQVRFKRFCYKDQAEFLGASTEYSDKEPI